MTPVCVEFSSGFAECPAPVCNDSGSKSHGGVHSLKPLSSRDQEKPQAKAAAEQPDGSIPPVAGFEGATTDSHELGPLADETRAF